MRLEAFEALYERHAQDLFGFLAYRTGDRALAEDLVADTFERAFKARRRFDPRRANEKTWLYAIALNLMRDYARRSTTQHDAFQKVLALGTPASNSIDSARARMDVMDALDVLTAEEREVIALRFGAQLSVPEIAEITGQELTTAEGRVYRAVRKLRGVLDPKSG